jgi:predicted MFS family arabinose efflux permease
VYARLLPGLVVASLGVGAVFVTATTTVLALVGPEEAGLASGVVNTFHEVGGSIGVAVLSTIAASGIEHGAIGGFRDAFGLSAAVAATSAPASRTSSPATRSVPRSVLARIPGRRSRFRAPVTRSHVAGIPADV